MGEMADYFLDCELARMTRFDDSRNDDPECSYYRSSKSEMFDFNLYVAAITGKAILCHYEGEDIWLPLSKIGVKNLVKNEFNDIKIPKWLCEIKGLTND